MGPTVLLIDDSASERAIVVDRLTRAGYQVETAADGAKGLRRMYELRPALVLLDVVMPGLDGWTTLERIREVSEVPVIMLTGRGETAERVRGLRRGADDYIPKPFEASELVARIEAVLRRAGQPGEPRPVWDDGEVRIDFRGSDVRARGVPVALTPLELRLLTTLVEHSGETLSRDRIADLVWGGAFGTDPEQVKLYVRRLRRKLERDPEKPELIETVRGFGYRYRAPARG